jgi:hypothetical protein
MSKFLYISRFCCIYEERTFHELDILPSSSSSSRPLYTHTGTLALVRRPRPRYHIDILCITVPRERERIDGMVGAYSDILFFSPFYFYFPLVQTIVNRPVLYFWDERAIAVWGCAVCLVTFD